MKILIFRIYLTFFTTVLITYEQNYCAYMYIQIYILKSFSFRYVSTWKGNTENRWKTNETGGYFRTADIQLPRIFSTVLKVLPLVHTYIVYHIDCVFVSPEEYLHGNTNSQEVSTPISLAREPTVLIYFLTAEAIASLANWLLFTVQTNETEKEEIKSSIHSLVIISSMIVIVTLLSFFESYYSFQLL